jgi:uncharacterized protein (DUF1800 family)
MSVHQSFLPIGAIIALLLSACASNGPATAGRAAATVQSDDQFLNRVTWGTSQASDDEIRKLGRAAYLNSQLHPHPARLPDGAENQINAMRISQSPLDVLVTQVEADRRAADAIADPDQKKTAQQAYQQELGAIAREAATRSLERDLYSPNQLQEQMTWFWLNHFNVNQNKSNIRVMIGDYEDHALRDHALGKFHDLLRATVLHPAMIRYLDNEQNANNHINENYARELMELHTLGVNGGYTQKDVQELARILTGLGININPPGPLPAKGPPPQRFGLVEFNPARHDFGDKVFLGHTIKGQGFAEIEQAIDILSKQPATAQFISNKIAVYFVSDTPPKALVERMSHEFMASNGDLAAVLKTMFDAPEFEASLNAKFKDPMHYVVSSVRLAYGDHIILNAQPMLGWLNRMGEPWSSHDTPDGYPLVASAWDSPGQMTTRFEIARAIGSGPAGLFKTDGDKPVEQPAFPQLSNALFYRSVEPNLKAPTREALAQATSPQEWNTFLLSSPELSLR